MLLLFSFVGVVNFVSIFDHVVARFCREIEHVLSDSRIWRQKNSAPDCMTDAPETNASFLAPVSGACVMGIRDIQQNELRVKVEDVAQVGEERVFASSKCFRHQ